MLIKFRYLHNQIAEWAKRPNRKPALLRGARQVGKSFSVRHWANETIPQDCFAEINFESQGSFHSLFGGDLDAKRIIEQIQISTGKKLMQPNSLLFLDEIQACPRAIMALRYFYEQMPQLTLIAAGSLLEFAFDEISFPVGRVESLYAFPLRFPEFVAALGKQHLFQLLETHPLNLPVPEPAHNELLHLLRLYFRIGGMPEAVATYIKSNDLSAVSKVLGDLTTTYQDDFAKYGRRIDPLLLRSVYGALPYAVGLQRIKYAKLVPDVRSDRVAACLDALEYARVISRIFATSGDGLPLSASANYKAFKLNLLDIGIMQQMLGFDWSRLAPDTDLTTVANGQLAEQFVGQELRAGRSESSDYRLHYWDRSNPGSNAEVDYIIEHQSKVTPIEVKSGHRGQLKSLQVFHQERGNELAYILSQRNTEQLDWYRWVPLYFAGRL
jgi:predicted AAA+ superfamily ATPase